MYLDFSVIHSVVVVTIRIVLYLVLIYINYVIVKILSVLYLLTE